MESYAGRGQAFGRELSDAFGAFGEKIPTFERTLDRYFDRNASAIVEKWGLLTTVELGQLEQRLNAISLEIDRLYGAKDRLGHRIARLDDGIRALEEGSR
jgi:hypothetical protein